MEGGERQMERDDASLDELCASFFYYRGRNMETSERIRGGGGVEEEDGGQFRKANIVYFLSRNGTVEHPHLLRVHHHRNNGVHLRDVKRWLGELRGKDMPDSFAWSYKRRYKNGYVWQDLKDEDLITPISDNEYVLKGSFLQFHSLNGVPSDHVGMTVKTPKVTAEKTVVEHQVAPAPKPEQPETLHIGPPRQPDRDSPVKPDRRSGDDVDRRMAVFRINAATARKQSEEEEEEEQRVRRSYCSRASHVFRNILTCGAADANEAVLMPVHRRAGGGGPHRRRSTSDVPPRQQPSQKQGSEGENSRKSRRSSGGKSGRPAGYKPLGAPNCLQCGRQFDPEKFQAHMQSCRGLRGSRRKGRPSVDRVPPRRESRSEEEFSRGSISGYLN